MGYAIAPLAPEPRTADDIRSELDWDRAVRSVPCARYSDWPGTFRFHEHAVLIRWDRDPRNPTLADLTAPAQRERGTLKRILDWLLHGIPWSGRGLTLSDDQVAYLIACDRLYSAAARADDDAKPAAIAAFVALLHRPQEARAELMWAKRELWAMRERARQAGRTAASPLGRCGAGETHARPGKSNGNKSLKVVEAVLSAVRPWWLCLAALGDG